MVCEKPEIGWNGVAASYFKSKNIIESNHMIRRILEIYRQNNTRTPLTSKVEALDIPPNENINNKREES